MRYVIKGNGSSLASALIDAINKHNERNPGKEVVDLYDSAVDPDLTNSKCSCHIALKVADRCLVMGHGQIVFDGTPVDLRANAYVRKEWLEV